MSAFRKLQPFGMPPIPDAPAPARAKVNGNGACPLSPYQLAVIQWIAHGKRDAEVADIMGNTTEEAIRQHVHRILNVLGAATRTGAAAIALRHGWIV